MTELLVASIALIIFAFVIYSSYSAQNAKYAQRKKAFELKEQHMEKTMDKIRSEINLIEKEVTETQEKIDELDFDSVEADVNSKGFLTAHSTVRHQKNDIFYYIRPIWNYSHNSCLQNNQRQF